VSNAGGGGGRANETADANDKERLLSGNLLDTLESLPRGG
jgi:hypothetical protein